MRMQQDAMQEPSDGSEFLSCIPDSLFPSYVPLSLKLLDTQFPQMSIYFSGWRRERNYALLMSGFSFPCKIKSTNIIILILISINTNIYQYLLLCYTAK